MALVESPPVQEPVLKRRRFPRGVRVLLGLALAAGLAVVYARAGRPAVVAVAGGPVRQVIATPRGLYWIEEGADASRLVFLGRVGGTPQALATGRAFTEMALYGPDVLLLDAGPAADDLLDPLPGGRLLRVPQAGGQPAVLAEGLHGAAGLYADDEGILWTETLPPRAPAVPHVPALGRTTLVRLLPRQAGEPRLAARLGGSAPVFGGEILGHRGGSLYLMDLRRARGEKGVTLLRSVPAEGGPPQTRRIFDGLARACLDGEVLYSTDVSTEAAPAGLYASVHRYPLSGEERTLLTDWLGNDGRLFLRRGALYYLGGDLWRVPARQDWPRVAVTGVGRPRAADIAGGFLYCARPASQAAAPGGPRGGSRVGPGGGPGGSPRGGPGAGPRGGPRGGAGRGPRGPRRPQPDEVVRWPLTGGARLRSFLRLW